MTDFLTFMTAPAAGCLILAVVFSYLGCHVLKREIVFVDLAMAQLAALGSTAAFVLGIDLHSPPALAMSLGCVLVGGAFFTYTRTLAHRIPQEAVIGIVYVTGASAALLMASLAPHGAEHLKGLLNGSILWITWKEVFELLGISLALAVPHWRFRHQMLRLSEDYKNAPRPAAGTDSVWDLMFYVSLGVIIVFAVNKAGIFLVFTLLIVPAVCAALITRSLLRQFQIGAGLAAGVCLAGLAVSFHWDLPTGAALVCTFGVVFFLFLILRPLFQRF